MPTLRHPTTGATWKVPDAVVAHWTGPGGWELADKPAAPPEAPRAPRRGRKGKTAPTPQTTPAPDAGAPDDDPGQGSSTTEHPKE